MTFAVSDALYISKLLDGCTSLTSFLQGRISCADDNAFLAQDDANLACCGCRGAARQRRGHLDGGRVWNNCPNQGSDPTADRRAGSRCKISGKTHSIHSSIKTLTPRLIKELGLISRSVERFKAAIENTRNDVSPPTVPIL